MNGFWKTIVVVVAAIVFLAVVGTVVVAYTLYVKNFTVAMPDYERVKTYRWLEQKWTAEERDWFHHADQGTLTFHIPYEWFMALEQPTLSVIGAGLLSDPTYLDRFGFIPSTTESNAYELPVIGMAKGKSMVDATASSWKNPRTHADMTRIGLTCAACHTGRFTYRQTTVLIDGGPALTDLGKFRTALGLSMFFTRHYPFRFDRFAKSIIGPDPTDAEKAELRAQLDKVLTQGKALLDLDTMVAPQSVTEGFARLDALNRIGNEVFAIDLKIPSNYAATSAPVHFPRIWDAPWFLWVQYDGSIMQPMIRNAGEALGVSAMVNLSNPLGDLYNSGVEAATLHDMEKLLAGKDQPQKNRVFTGLNSPKWPSDLLPPIDTKLAEQGAALYKEHCQDCHFAPVGTADFWTSDRWLPPNAFGYRYLDVKLIPIDVVGTDPAQAVGLLTRRVRVPPELGVASSNFGDALKQVVEKTVTHWYDSQKPPTPQAMRDEMNGYRENYVQSLASYKARPLNGAWATPPYLHNASVPTLYALLSPAAERPKKFYLGHREYDPKDVGYEYQEPLHGGFEMDTTLAGNSNAGHEFKDGNGKGVIGPLLKPGQRRALVEYLKTL
jgi:hypothetical protein